MITCVYCGAGSGHWPWCTRPGFLAMAEPVNVHASWCRIWTHETGDCNCGAG